MDRVEHIFRKVELGIEGLFGGEKHSHTHSEACAHDTHDNRYQSFAPQSRGRAKYYVDGASYFWAAAEAIENARETIYILDWWLSPELYLRRPPASNEQYRLDNLLRAAAERGVQIRVIVYKEVTQALTLNSEHTKHALEALHPNIRVFRHPDHYPRGHNLQQGFQNMSLDSFNLSKLGGDAIKSIYGTSDDMVLFWAHHEKLLAIDGKLAFMGGLDMCFGRWDTQSHPIADAHPSNVANIVFPGQDYNNARVYDFEDVSKWENNKLDRTKSSRMGWSDVSISLDGPIVNSLLIHFVDRWNYIFTSKYGQRDKIEYAPLEPPASHSGQPVTEDSGAVGSDLLGHLNQRFQRGVHRFIDNENEEGGQSHETQDDSIGQLRVQLARSCSKWSAGHATEHSIANAYIEAITNAKHYVYIENQFFITATSNEQHPVDNKIGKAMVDRIVRAHQNGENFRIIVIMPAVPAFAGDLKSEGALGTRAIMEFQYNSINRGGHSIMQALEQAGVQDPRRYITFFNLRNYDRINVSAVMGQAERESGVPYEEARRQFDDSVESGYDGYSREQTHGRLGDQYQRYQEAASRVEDHTFDTVAACYMEAGPDLRSVAWQGSAESEINAFVSEQLYIHSKLLIADDNLTICGSANLNDRSQLGDHDSEIAVIIEDTDRVESSMGGQPFQAGRFASALRRTIFRKVLGLLPHQPHDRPNSNWTPVSREPNNYDWGSPADRLVEDPLSEGFWNLWTTTARTNTEVFSKVFHNVPNDAVRTWEQYDDFFSRHFIVPGAEVPPGQDNSGKVDYGHVVREEFPGGVGEVKEWLGRVRGTLVEMPLNFLIDVPDIAITGLSLNTLTEELYT